MTLQTKTALGIDISCSRISMALLRKDKDGLKLLKSADCPVPEGAINNGNIEDPLALAKEIKQLKVKNKIHAPDILLSPVINPILMQILDLPQDVSGNVRQFVYDESKRFALLSMKDIEVDYCGIKSSGKTSNRRVFVAATEVQKIAELVVALNKMGLKVKGVEPFQIAYLRACYTKQIAGLSDRNLLFAIIRNNIFTLCVFKNQNIDFVQVKQLKLDETGPDDFFNFIVENINAVLKFYEMKIHDKCSEWQVNLVVDTTNNLIKEQIEKLAVKHNDENSSYNLWQTFKPLELKVRWLQDAYVDTPVTGMEHNCKPSIVAVGLAMKPLDSSDCSLNIDLLPEGLTDIEPAKKYTFIIANIAAVIFLLVILAVGFFSMRTKDFEEAIQKKQQAYFGCDIQALLDEQVLLKEQIGDISGNLDNMSNILNDNSFIRWDDVLDEIRSATPQPVRITHLSSEDELKVNLKGQAFSYESVRFFVQMLNESEYMKSASLIGTEKDGTPGGLIMYSINCLLTE